MNKISVKSLEENIREELWRNRPAGWRRGQERGREQTRAGRCGGTRRIYLGAGQSPEAGGRARRPVTLTLTLTLLRSRPPEHLPRQLCVPLPRRRCPGLRFSRTALGVLYGGRRRLNPSPPFIRTCERRTCPDLSRLPKQIPLARDATRRWPPQRPDRGPLPPRPAPRARTAEGRALLPPEPWASRHLRAQRGAARDPAHTGLKLSPAGLQVLG